METGGWSDFVSPISEEQEKVFDNAMEHFTGVKYTPIAAAQQVVAGMNFCYICLARIVIPDASVTVAKVTVYAPPSGEPHITAIEPVAP
jgi:hypothetical protein